MKLPSYRLHKPTGQAIVVFQENGARQFHYLGKYGTPESRAKYEKLIGAYLAAGRAAPKPDIAARGITLRELAAAYLAFAADYYRHPDGTTTDELPSIRSMNGWVTKHAGDFAASAFSPSILKTIRDKMIEAGDSRKYINQQVGRMVRMMKWAVEQELVPPDVWQRLKAVSPLKKGRTAAKERPAIPPAPEDHVTATLDHLADDVADMVRLQRLTGMRPGELWRLQPCDVDRSGDIWKYTPSRHKTAWRGKRRVIHIGPKGQAVLLPYLLRPADELCFSRPGGKAWDRFSYRDAVHTACKLAGVPPWNPNQLRHSHGTEVRKQYGLEGAQVALGHSHAAVTEIYAEADAKKAEEIARKLG